MGGGAVANVGGVPILAILLGLSRSSGWAEAMPNAQRFLLAVQFINRCLLIFNLLPIYPLDGGQILRSLLWFVVGRARSLMMATIIGFVGVAALIGAPIMAPSVWFGL